MDEKERKALKALKNPSKLISEYRESVVVYKDDLDTLVGWAESVLEEREEGLDEPLAHRLSKDGHIWDYSMHFQDIVDWITKIRSEEPNAFLQIERAPISEWNRWREG